MKTISIKINLTEDEFTRLVDKADVHGHSPESYIDEVVYDDLLSNVLTFSSESVLDITIK